MSILDEIKPYQRKTWKPVVIDGDGLPTDSKFAGTPFVKKDEDYPICPNCKKELQLFVQLNLNKLPSAVNNKFGQGLIQLFYCTSENPYCEVDCEAFFPFSKSVLARIVNPESLSNPNQVVSFSGTFPPKLITDWKELEDYPNWQEYEMLGLELDSEKMDEIVEDYYPVGGDKLDGYPMWIQGIEYPNCPICEKQMQLVFQIDSEDNLPHMFGDVGCGHLTQCETHKEQLAFGWACC